MIVKYSFRLSYRRWKFGCYLEKYVATIYTVSHLLILVTSLQKSRSDFRLLIVGLEISNVEIMTVNLWLHRKLQFWTSF